MGGSEHGNIAASAASVSTTLASKLIVTAMATTGIVLVARTIACTQQASMRQDRLDLCGNKRSFDIGKVATIALRGFW